MSNKDFSNYHLVTLISNTLIIVKSISRPTNIVDENQPREQTGLGSGRRTIKYRQIA